MRAKSIRVTKIFTFDCAHKLTDYDGKCSHLHGHTYRLEVTLKGLMVESGIMFDFSLLKKVVEENVVSRLDHKYLNEEFDFSPTCENIALWIFNQIDACFENMPCELDSLKLWETATSYAELRRSDFV